MKQESLEMFLECFLATTITNVNIGSEFHVYFSVSLVYNRCRCVSVGLTQSHRHTLAEYVLVLAIFWYIWRIGGWVDFNKL